MTTRIVVLAAGLGKRMNSDLPKVLHCIGGKPMLEHVLDAAAPLTEKPPLVVHGSNGDMLKSAMVGKQIDWVLQSEQLGTGHAVLQTLPLLEDSELVIILCADIPLIRSETLNKLVDTANNGLGFSVLTVDFQQPHGYGRILRKENGNVDRIVETSDLATHEVGITECNSGIFAFKASLLKRWLPSLSKDNAQGELYLTDCVSFASSEGSPVLPVIIDDSSEAMGVNNKKQLALAERIFQKRVTEKLMESGVTLLDPERLDVRGDLVCEKDVTIDINVIFIGKVSLGRGVYIGPNSVIKNCAIAENSVVHENCVLESASVESDCTVGPFSRLRPGTMLSRGATVGNFVEVKNSSIGEGTKINHLSYVGDAEVGREVNIGAGTITCNYDGASKQKTVIEDDAFVGSNTELVAPVKIGSRATIGAGSTITKDVGDDALVVTRTSQKSISGWKRPSKVKKDR